MRGVGHTLADSSPSAERDAAFGALESVPQPIVLVDGHERIAFLNQYVVHAFGFAVAELIGQPFDRLLRGSPSRPVAAVLTDMLRHERPAPASIEADALCRDGTSRPVLIDVGRLGPFVLFVLRPAGERREPRAGAPVEARLKEAQRIAKLGSWTWDLVTGEHWWSDELYRMLQIDPAAESRPFERYLELIAPADRARIAARAELVSNGQPIEPIDVQVTLPDGTRRVFQSQSAATRDASGQAVQLRGTLQDVTEHQANEAALRRTEMRYREAQRLAKIGNWEWDLSTNMSWWSDELYRILEENPRDYPATFANFLHKVHPDDQQVLIDGQSVIAAGPDAYRTTESRVLFPDGREKIVEQIVEPRVDTHGTPIAIVGTVHDITERRALEIKLRESEARYASTVELAAVGIAHVGADGRFNWCNGRLREMLGYDNDELLALTIWDISHPEDAHMADRDRPRLHAAEIDTLTIEKRCVRKDGATIWVRIRSATRRNANFEFLYDVAIIDDITARKAAEARVQYLATHDELTGLLNRTLFGELLEHAIDTAQRCVRR